MFRDLLMPVYIFSLSIMKNPSQNSSKKGIDQKESRLLRGARFLSRVEVPPCPLLPVCLWLAAAK